MVELALDRLAFLVQPALDRTIYALHHEPRDLLCVSARDAQYECVKEFENLANVATDYLLFSLGKGRWNPREQTEP